MRSDRNIFGETTAILLELQNPDLLGSHAEKTYVAEIALFILKLVKNGREYFIVKGDALIFRTVLVPILFPLEVAWITFLKILA